MTKHRNPLNRSVTRFKNLFRNPFFWAMTLFGNGFMLTGSFLLWIVEGPASDGKIGFIDCMLWSAGMMTTIGFGDSAPQTLMGKLIILALMLFGTLFMWAYMGFLVTGLIAPELSTLERDVHGVERELRELRKE